MEIFKVQRDKIEDISVLLPFVRRYFGLLNVIDVCLKEKIMVLSYEVNTNQGVGIAVFLNINLIKRSYELDLHKKIKCCFYSVNEYVDPRVNIHDDETKRLFLIQSIHHLREALEKIPEFSIALPK